MRSLTMNKSTTSIFLTGIHTDAGKTIASAVVCQATGAAYWKPVQSGYPEDSDRRTVTELVSHPSFISYDEAYTLKAPLSPHAAAEREGVTVDLQQIRRPETDRDFLLIEGAGGLIVPLNNEYTIADLIEPNDKVILVSRHYLGSINHTGLSIAYLNQRGIRPGVLFVGEVNTETESAIARLGDAEILGRLDWTSALTPTFVAEQSEGLQSRLMAWLND